MHEALSKQAANYRHTLPFITRTVKQSTKHQSDSRRTAKQRLPRYLYRFQAVAINVTITSVTTLLVVLQHMHA